MQRHRPLNPGARSVPPQWDLDVIVQRLRESRENTHKIRHRGHVRELPSMETLGEIIDCLKAALFPTHYSGALLDDESIDFFVGNTLNDALTALHEQIRRSLFFDHADGTLPAPHSPEWEALSRQHLERAAELTRAFAAELPALRALMVSDLRAAYQGDPAAGSLSEILLCYPGTAAIMLYRFAHALYALGLRLVARLIGEIAHTRTGVDIHPGASIGGSFFIDHGTGVVIGETSIVGERVRLYQAVTLGAKRFPTDDEGNLVKGIARHPIVEDDVVVYAGATILGRITIGRGSTVGGNVWLTHSVPPGSNISQAQHS